MDPICVGVLTVSDGVARGEREDRSGDAIAAWVAARGYVLGAREVVPDQPDLIAGVLALWADSGSIDVVLTTGGTGFAPRDFTPEATRSVIQREAPGLADAIRRRGAESTPFAYLSRGIAGIRGRTLIVNLPGSTNAVRGAIEVLDPLIDHAVQLLRGIDTERHASNTK